MYGVVVFAGKETKLVQNSGKVAFKRTHLDKLLNVLVLTVSLVSGFVYQLVNNFIILVFVQIFLFLFLLCLIASVGAAMWEKYTGDSSSVYLPPQVIMGEVYDLSPIAVMALSFIAYIILLNTVVPISLYVTLVTPTNFHFHRMIFFKYQQFLILHYGNKKR